MYLNERQIQIITSCIHNGFHTTLNLLQKLTGVSEKTLKKDVQIINDQVSKYESAFILNNKDIIFQSIYTATHWLNILTLSIRIKDIDMIRLTLLLKKDYITITDLANELYISKSKLEKLILNNPIIFNDLTKVRNMGVLYDFDELTRLSKFIIILKPYIDPVNYLVSTRQLINQITFTNINMEDFNNAVTKFNNYNLDNYSDITTKQIFIIILLKQLKLIKNEVEYIFKQFNLYEIENTIDIDNLNIDVQFYLEDETLIMTDNYNFKLLIDHLYRSLTTHLTDYEMEASFIAKLELEFAYALSLAINLLSNLGLKYKHKFSEDEKYFVAIYLQTLIEIEPRFDNINILIVCEYGISVSNYLKFKLEQLLVNNVAIKTSSIYLFHKENKDNYDLILTTLDNLEADNTQIQRINPMPNALELDQIKTTILNKSSLKTLERLVNQNLIFDGHGLTNHKNMVNLLKENLKDRKLCDEKYYDNLAQRIKSGITPYNGVIIYHADSKYVLKNQIVIINNLQRLEGNLCQSVFVFLFDHKFIRENQEFIKQIYRLIGNEKYMQSIHEFTNMNQFKYLFTSFIRN